MENQEKLESLSKDKWWNRTEDTNWGMEGDMKIFDKCVLENMGTNIWRDGNPRIFQNWWKARYACQISR